MNLRYMKRAAIAATTALIVSNWVPLAPLGNQTAHADPTQVSCGNRVALINGSFEEPDLLNLPSNDIHENGGSWYTIDDDFVPGWQTTDSTGTIEFSSPTKLGVDPRPESKYHYVTDVPDGEQYVELNAYNFGQLYQDVQTTPGQTISWRLFHRAAYEYQTPGDDTMDVRIGSSTTDPSQLPVVETIKTHTSQGWKEYRGSYVVPAGQTVTRFGFKAVGSVLGYGNSGNFLDDIFLGTEPCGVVTKSVDPVDNVQEGDTLTYTVNFKNEGGDETGNTVFTDTIPDGTEYIPGSLEIVSGPNTGKLTDKSGDDQGEFLENEKRVVVRLGNGANQSQAGRIPNTDVLPNGTTVQFKVKILSKYKTTTVANQATVGYDNLLTGTHEERKSNGVTVDVNRPPISPDFEETTWSGINVTGSVYGVDANGDPLTFEKGKDPEKGKVTVGPTESGSILLMVSVILASQLS